MTTPFVQYRYANGSGNQIRPTRTTYPDGRELNLDYGSAGGQADLLGRVAALVDDDGSTRLADYSYLGLGAPVITDYTQPDVRYTLVGTAGGNDPDTGDIYRGLDRFGRVKDAYWRDYGANTDAARIQYGYDRAGNRTYRADPVAVANGAQYEELYGYDGLQRLKTMDRGTLNGGKTALTTKSFDQCWTLDPTGNWKGFRQDDTGDGAWDLIQARTSNPVNEITNIANSVGSAWANPAYDAAGNMTTIPQPANPSQSYTATYDAWNRLVKLQDGANTVAEYQYDARNYRTVAKSYAGGVLDETRHFYYTDEWQSIEERLGTNPDSADPDRQFVWGLRYIDDCVLRDRDTNADGTLDERLYALQDGNWNVIALTDASGDVQERYAYQAYGTPKFLTAGFGNRASRSFEWETLFCGYRWESTSSALNVRHRIYSALTGIWDKRDPLGVTMEINLYQYALSNPLRHTDPLGLQIDIVPTSELPSGPPRHPGTPFENANSVASINGLADYLKQSCCDAITCDDEMKRFCEVQAEQIEQSLNEARDIINTTGGATRFRHAGNVCVDVVRIISNSLTWLDRPWVNDRTPYPSCFSAANVNYIPWHGAFGHSWMEIQCNATGDLTTVDMWSGTDQVRPWGAGRGCFSGFFGRWLPNDVPLGWPPPDPGPDLPIIYPD